MRKLVCLIILICSFSFAETVPVAGANVEGAPVDLEGVHAETTSEDSTRSVGIFELYSHEIRTSKYLFSFGMDVTTWTNHADYLVGVWFGQRIADGLYLNSMLWGLHFLSDETDSCSRTGATAAFHSLFFLTSSVSAIITYSDKMLRVWSVVAALLNPTLEFFIWRKYVPVSIGIGYNTDWFAFSPEQRFYLRAHADLNVNITWARFSASYSYSFFDTYDLKKGSKRIYLKIIFGPEGLGS